MSFSPQPTAADYLKDIVAAPVYWAAKHTPTDAMPVLSKRLNNRVLVKREDLQPVHSFKIRGAFNRMAQLSPEERNWAWSPHPPVTTRRGWPCPAASLVSRPPS